ncbi:MAG TPA: hypothetical protein VN950_19140 [Terriglobales bacterium]|nr:hypothetical protein [Terriglobales bacterium]
MLTSHVVVLHDHEAVGILVIPAELDVSKLQGDQLAAAKTRAQGSQEQRLVIRTDHLRGFDELMCFHWRQRDTLSLFALRCTGKPP